MSFMEIKKDSPGLVSLRADGEKSILQILRALDPEYLSAPCGGKGLCGKCRVRAWGALRSLSQGGVLIAAGEEIPACQYAPVDECRVLPVKGGGELISLSTMEAIPTGGKGLGAAVDIGTTTIAMLLYELETGCPLAEERAMNIQRAYGADVLSRITAAKERGLEALCDPLQTQLSALLHSLCKKAGRSPEELKRLVLCGNTVMQHFAAALDPASIALPPFSPLCLFEEGSAGEREERLLPGAEIFYCPCVSGYVGGDLVSGLSAELDLKKGKTILYMDIGTNGELALGNDEGFLCCATAAGPAFEGAELSCGMNGGDGAIDRVYADGDDIALHVIGGGKANGICGSGVIDAVAVLLELGVIKRSGRFEKAARLPEKLAARLINVDGRSAFLLAEGVYLSIDDIRAFQLAKAAIRSGAELLLSRRGKTAADVDELIIAGGFGAGIDIEKAKRTGLLPPVPIERIRAAGNAALKGAALALTDEGREKLKKTAALCRYEDLSGAADFSALYLAELNFKDE